ncbi:hypothetical protein PR048_021279 [Dryococelus australis]|uniref:Uncharacterized protein n=1 Tax=Dryococelus australis TaxID=614101 RepID=A0ABQ9GXU7_9NEOP|nr:hypothetical protein PR048_021279 [Dryococelus australis]
MSRLDKSMDLITSFFGDCIISKNLCPLQFYDLTSPDFHLWNYMKNKVYKNRPCTLAKLQQNIRNEITNINENILWKTSQNMMQ